jgi:hypothetical protein
MRKLIYISVAVLSFVSGILIYYIHPAFIPISLLELRGNPKRHQIFSFKVRGDFQVWKAESTYFFELIDERNECALLEPPCSRSLELPNEVMSKNNNLIEDLASKNQQLGKTDLRKGINLAEVEITGILEERKTGQMVNFNGIDSYFILKVEKIEQLSPVRFVESKGIIE